MENKSRLKIELPVVKGKVVVFPDKPLCPWCQAQQVYEPNSMAVLNAGTMRRLGYDRSEMATDTTAFFSLIWHGAHLDAGGVGRDADISASVDIAEMVASGQFELYFCSTDCLRSFLNYCVDELEWQIATAKMKKG